MATSYIILILKHSAVVFFYIYGTTRSTKLLLGVLLVFFWDISLFTRFFSATILLHLLHILRDTLNLMSYFSHFLCRALLNLLMHLTYLFFFDSAVVHATHAPPQQPSASFPSADSIPQSPPHESMSAAPSPPPGAT